MGKKNTFQRNLRITSAAFAGIFSLATNSTPYAADNNEIGLLAAMIIAKSMSSTQSSPTSLYELLTEPQNSKSEEPFALDSQTFTKLYQRGTGETVSIVSFSMETKVLDKSQRSSDFYPTLEQYRTTKAVMELLFQIFKQENLDEKLLADKLFEPPVAILKDNEVSENIKGEENIEENIIIPQKIPVTVPAATKSDLMNQAQAILTSLSTKLMNNDFETSIILSYYDLTRELKLTLKTDSSPETIAQIPLRYAEMVYKNPLKFFENLEEWLESTLTTKLKIFHANGEKKDKKREKNSYLSMFS